MATHRILVVDDDRSVHDLLTPVFQSRDWKVESAYNGLDALWKVQSEAFDLVVTGIHQPGINGIDLLRRIRMLRPHTKVLVITAEDAKGDVIRAIQNEAFAYFSKPLSPGNVADMISQALTTPSWGDDIQVLSGSPTWIALRVRCKLDTADRLVQFLREMKMDLAVEKREDIAAALRELLMNAIEHGGQSNPQKFIQVSYMRTSRAIVYFIQDPGQGFSLAAVEHAAIANPPGEPTRHVEIRAGQGVRPGGFGILLTRNLVDELVYNERGNEVLFIKYLE